MRSLLNFFSLCFLLMATRGFCDPQPSLHAGNQPPTPTEALSRTAEQCKADSPYPPNCALTWQVPADDPGDYSKWKLAPQPAGDHAYGLWSSLKKAYVWVMGDARRTPIRQKGRLRCSQAYVIGPNANDVCELQRGGVWMVVQETAPQPEYRSAEPELPPEQQPAPQYVPPQPRQIPFSPAPRRIYRQPRNACPPGRT